MKQLNKDSLILNSIVRRKYIIKYATGAYLGEEGKLYPLKFKAIEFNTKQEAEKAIELLKDSDYTIALS